MNRSLDTLSNLAFLYILAGGVLPIHGFENVTDNLESNLDGDLDGYQGVGVEEVQDADFVDDAAVQQTGDYNGWDGAEETGGEYTDMIGNDGAVYEESGNMLGETDTGTYGDFAGDSVVRGTDIEPTAAEYPSAFAQDDFYPTGKDSAFDTSLFGGGGDAADGAGDCDCGEGLGDILSSILDVAGDVE